MSILATQRPAIECPACRDLMEWEQGGIANRRRAYCDTKGCRLRGIKYEVLDHLSVRIEESK